MFAYSGQVNAACDATALTGAQCTLSVANPITIASNTVVPVRASINIPNNAAPGSYNIHINTQDLAGAPSHSVTMALTVTQDFTLGALTPSTQTIKPGQSASYNFSVLPVGALFPDAVSLSCSGGPTISLCTFTPSSVTPGSSSAAVVMTISTTASSAALPLFDFPLGLPFGSAGRSIFYASIFYAMWLALPTVCLLRAHFRSQARLPVSLIAICLLGFLLASCGSAGSNGGSGGGGGGGGGGGTGGQKQGTTPGTYLITVTGTSGTLSHPLNFLSGIILYLFTASG
jgi:hypothetical protein